MKRFFRISIKILAALIALFVLAAIVIHLFFAEEVKSYALKQVQAQLNSKMDIGEVDFSLWRHFPKASIELKKVYIEDTFGGGDTLLYADRLSLAFNVINLFSGTYTVNYLAAENADIRLKLKEDGSDNYHFWKESPDSTTEAKFKFEISEMDLSEATLLYDDREAKLLFDSHVDELNLNGLFSNEKNETTVEGQILLNTLKIAQENYLSGEAIRLDAQMQFEDDFNTVIFQSAVLELRDSEVELTGVWKSANPDIKIKTKGAELDLLRAILPDLMDKVERDYGIDGSFDFEGRYTSIESKDDLSGEFSLSGGKLEHKGSGEKLDEIHSRAAVHVNKNKTTLDVTEASGSFRSGQLSAAGVVEFAEQTSLNVSINGQLKLEELKEFFGLDTLELFEGAVNAAVEYTGQISNGGLTAEDIKAAKMGGRVVVEGANIKVRGNKNTLENIYGTMVLADGNAAVQGLKATVGSSAFEAEGMLKNFIPYLIDTNEHLQIETSFRSAHIDLAELLSEDGTASAGTYDLNLPQNVGCNLNLLVEKITFKEFVATNLRGVGRMLNGDIRISPVQFETAGGSFIADFNLRKQGEGEAYTMVCEANMQKIDIRELFRQFGNFGQTFITDSHLKGRANANIAFKSKLKNDLSIDAASIESLIDLNIENGELIGLESLQSISEYLRKNKLISAFADPDEFDSKMKHIHFQSLHNQIEIKNRVIHIPTMDIASSAMDIRASGKHGFDNSIDYSMNFRIRDILRKKKSEFGEEMDDGLGGRFFLAMTGTTTAPEFSFDKEALREKRKEDIQREKEAFKSLLREEFGLFNRKKEEPSATEGKTEQGGSNVNMTISWDEDSVPSPQQTTKPKEDKKKKGWLERMVDDEAEEEDKVKIQIDDEER
jgi:uncharacterized protein involved in outer membrane biogenesis